jgi:uncharacterized protein YndB with AHSA1/START domain
MTTTEHSMWIDAPPPRVYDALLDPKLIAQWRVPDGMSCVVHRFEPCEGGVFRISLRYDEPDAAGKTSAHTDTYHGHFEELIPNRRVVETLEFESPDPRMQGKMRIATELKEERGGTRLTAVHENLPTGVSPADNEDGWRQSLAKLEALLKSAA